MKRFEIRMRLHSLVASISEFFFWVIAYFVLLNMFAGSSQWQMIDYIYTSIFIGTIIICVTINSWLLIPRLLKQKKYLLYCALGILNVLALAFFNHILFDKLIDYILPGYYFISYYSYTDLLKFFFAFVSLTTLIHLSWEWFQLQETKHRYALLEREKIDAEFKALSNQVNPHFLFNSLTVLYSLALKNSGETPGAIIKLSDILRYVIYESATGKVPIRSEIDLIQNYIDLQRHRIHASTQIEFVTEVAAGEANIVPMILLPLVENSFKHGAKGDIENTFIRIRLQSVNGIVNFNIVNNKTASESGPSEKTGGGIGLANIRNRLKLMYPQKHTLHVDDSEKTFSVLLTLQTI
jgi:hypothetical protein